MLWSYRPALDGLRSLAVYLVLLFHTGVAAAAGGFVGVDLFFVLSGFLVTTILLQELAESGHLDLAHFYDRRIRRLLPAAVLVIVVCCAAAVLMLSTVRRVPLVGDAQAALLYVANWRFLLQSNDYFEAGSVDSSLFLHFWSLSIEEQFYFFFPLLLLLLARLDRRRAGRAAAGAGAGRRITVLVVAGLFVASLVAQVLWARVDANHAYYGTEARLYQLLAGSLLALALSAGRLPRLAAPARLGASLAALVGLLVVASSLVDVSPSVRGLLATVAAVGLVALLAPGTPGPLTSLFSQPPLVYLGKISYGTYLWHWPVIVLLREVLDSSVLVTTVVVAALSTALAAASYHMLERPIRTRKLAPRAQLPVVVGGLALSTTVALLVVPPMLHQERRPELVALSGATTTEAGGGPVPKIDFQAVERDVGGAEQHCSAGDLAPCERVTGNPGPTVLLVGDSHARMLEPALTTLARKHGLNLSVSIVGHCPWQRGLVAATVPEPDQAECAQARQDLYDDVVTASHADVVVLTERPRSGGEALAPPPGEPRPSSDAELIVGTTTDSLHRLDELGVRSLVVQSIWLPRNLPQGPLECLATARTVGECRVPVVPTTGLLDATFVTEAARSDSVFTVDINPIMCPAAPVCEPLLDGVPVWRDDLHFSSTALSLQQGKIWDAMVATGVFEGLP